MSTVRGKSNTPVGLKNWMSDSVGSCGAWIHYYSACPIDRTNHTCQTWCRDRNIVSSACAPKKRRSVIPIELDCIVGDSNGPQPFKRQRAPNHAELFLRNQRY